MGAVQIKELSHTHQAFMDYMLLNPHASLKDMSACFGYTVAWISTVINSDAFQAEFALRRKDISARVASTTLEKIKIVADMGLDRLMDIVPHTGDADLVLETTDKMLKCLGISHKTPPGALQGSGPAFQQNNFFVLSKDKLSSLRGQIVNGQALPVAPDELPDPTAAALSLAQGDSLGQVCGDSSIPSEVTRNDGSSETGSAV